jgi:ribokinase
LFLKPIVVVGSINIDLVVRAGHIPRRGETTIGQSFQTFFGGKGANQAVGVARLGYPVSMVGKVGSDGFGDQLLAELKRAGVADESVMRAPGSSGIAVITTEESAENTIIVVPGANGRLRPSDIENNTGLLLSAAMVLTQLEIPMETVSKLAQVCLRHDVPLILDPAPAADLPADILRCLAWLTPNETELLQLTHTDGEIKEEREARELAESLMSKGAQNILLKLGAKGSYLATKDGVRKWIPAIKVIAKDTTAAGDAYNAAFAVALCEGRSPENSAQFASAAAAISVMREGAQPSLANREEVDGLLVKERC